MIVLAVMILGGFIMSLLGVANAYENGRWFPMSHSQLVSMVGGMLVGIGIAGVIVAGIQ